MQKKYRAFVRWFPKSRNSGGKITVAAMLSVAIVVVTSFGAYFELYVPNAHAGTAVSTAVTVLNTPPQWTVIAQESAQSSTSTPTNLGTTLSFTALATDSGGDNYWLIVCSASSTPTPNISAAPTCGGGSFPWAVSSVTTSGASSTASTTTSPSDPQFQGENHAWFAYVCDGNPTGPACNPVVEQGSGTTVSPFVINHPPTFTSIVNSGGVNPGAIETWTSTATDTDVIRGGDLLTLYVCKANDFIAGTGCGAGGTWGVSIPARINPAATSSLPIPSQDTSYNAFVFIQDNNSLAATTTTEASNNSFLVNAVAPTISAASISLVDTSGSGDMKLTVPAATSGPFKITFTVNDNNSCLNASSTNEIATVSADAYRSAVTQASCKNTGDFNSDNCYPYASPYSGMICTQTSTSTCTATVTTINFSCTFNLWYNADPTDPNSVFAAQNWLASASSTAWKGATSTEAESSVGNELDSLVAFGMTKTSISYGGLQPGNSVALSTTTDLIEQGNTGLDESLYGSTMCTTFNYPTVPDPDQCDAGGVNAGTKIPVVNQQFASSSIAYNASGSNPLTASTSPSLFGLHVQKTTATSTPNTKNTFWGILIPGAITLSGNYSGQNTVTAVESSSTNW